MRQYYFLAGLLMLLLPLSVVGQQDAQFTQYMFNQLYYNPAFAGVDGVTKLTAVHRSQWLGYSPTVGGGGAPTTQVVSMTTPIYKLNSGFGAYIVHDVLGPQNNDLAQVSYAYHMGIKDSKLSFGVRVGGYMQTINYGMYRPIDPIDPAIKTSGKDSQIRPDISAGVFFRKEKYYAGISFNHLVKSSFSFGTSARNALQNHMYLTGGYYYDVSFDVRLLFTTLIQSDFNSTSVNLGGIVYLKDKMWGGLSFRQSEAVSLLMGYSLLKDNALKLGYSLDYVVKDQKAKTATSHELVLTYELPVNPAGKKIIRTPRYRH
ncbi:MAG: type IX secretion system membrane protein PorP/SprF [Cyclobacteriaceae bacterium]|nr:type IX secretion system membrane protein PorP/SprF [Cyclobacteriaceae bacterium]